ncbi:MAG: hypothetical protein AAF195_02445 [Pseudomonadota bacterium]
MVRVYPYKPDQNGYNSNHKRYFFSRHPLPGRDDVEWVSPVKAYTEYNIDYFLKITAENVLSFLKEHDDHTIANIKREHLDEYNKFIDDCKILLTQSYRAQEGGVKKGTYPNSETSVNNAFLYPNKTLKEAIQYSSENPKRNTIPKTFFINLLEGKVVIQIKNNNQHVITQTTQSSPEGLKYLADAAAIKYAAPIVMDREVINAAETLAIQPDSPLSAAASLMKLREKPGEKRSAPAPTPAPAHDQKKPRTSSPSKTTPPSPSPSRSP